MNKFKFLSVIIIGALLVTFSSCDKVTDLADITFDTSLSSNISATSAGETRADTTYAFSGSAIVDPTSDSTINKYWDNLKSWNIQKVTLKVKTISQDATMTEGHLIVKDNNTEDVLFTADATGFPLTAGTVIMEVTSGDWVGTEAALMAQHSLFISIDGALDQPNVDVTFTVVVDSKVTANPL
ncbi:MAG: hypothetical protein DRJ09_00285 [Bacteroidetes bacterium]|nr:MAG: hypothetical protein DRJ09_00285 [Bacteroidota bacterium]